MLPPWNTEETPTSIEEGGKPDFLGAPPNIDVLALSFDVFVSFLLDEGLDWFLGLCDEVGDCDLSDMLSKMLLGEATDPDIFVSVVDITREGLLLLPTWTVPLLELPVETAKLSVSDIVLRTILWDWLLIGVPEGPVNVEITLFWWDPVTCDSLAV